MKKLLIIGLIVGLGCAQTSIQTPSIETKNYKPGLQIRKFIVIDAFAPSAPFRSYADSTDEKLGRIPAGTKLEILDRKEWMMGKGKAEIKQTWYNVKYKGRIGWVSYYCTVGPGEIIREPPEFDGLKLGYTRNQIEKIIKSLPGVVTANTKGDYIEKVPGIDNKYRYYIKRTPTLNSEVGLIFKNGKLITIRNVYTGDDTNTINSASATYNKLIKDFSQQLGKPMASSSARIIWTKENIIAELWWERPVNKYAYPNVIFTIYLK